MKALEMLYRDKKWIEEECDISKIPIERVQTTIKDLVEINEAIAELEALQQSKQCNTCRFYHSFTGVCANDNCHLCADFVDADFGCIYHEPKEQWDDKGRSKRSINY